MIDEAWGANPGDRGSPKRNSAVCSVQVDLAVDLGGAWNDITVDEELGGVGLDVPGHFEEGVASSVHRVYAQILNVAIVVMRTPVTSGWTAQVQTIESPTWVPPSL